MEKFKTMIGRKIKERRKELGFKTQDDLAKAIGADRTRVSRWESGENIPDPAYRDALLEHLKLPKGFFEEVNFRPSKVDHRSTSKDDSSRNEMLVTLMQLLPALNDRQLRQVLALVSGHASGSDASQTGTDDV